MNYINDTNLLLAMYFLQIKTRQAFPIVELFVLGRISGSHGGEYEDGCLLGCSAV
jgi:hypothetical protein